MRHTQCYLPGYPRPQFVRAAWQDLCGEWDLCFDDADAGERLGWQRGFAPTHTIIVPFVYSCEASGIGDGAEHDAVWYQRHIDIPSEKGRVLLVFEGSDYETTVWLNGERVGSHCGAYARFSFDVTDAVKAGKNLLVVRVRDDSACDKPRGKQSWTGRCEECWYLPCTGIYKPVWLDLPAQESYLAGVKITPRLEDDSVTFDFTCEGCRGAEIIRAQVSFEGKFVAEGTIAVRRPCETLRLDLRSDAVFFKTRQWSPARPNLYDVRFFLEREGRTLDEVGSYFALREVRTDGNRILLNNNATYFKLVLDQGYYDGSLLTPKDEAELERDVVLAKELGFNGVRKHEKTEDERYFYYADVYGLFVWCEMPSFYLYNDRAAQRALTEWGEIVRQFYNHPSVVCWVCCNESWGVGNVALQPAMQNFTQAMYFTAKTYDPFRPVVSNDGWEHTRSDLLTLHQYQQDAALFTSYFCEPERLTQGWCKGRGKMPFAKGFSYTGQPVLITEFGGASFAPASQGWGYGGQLGGVEEWLERLRSLMQAVQSLDGCAGYCYTQLTDVMQEKNGLLYSDRTPKAAAERIKKINDGIFTADEKKGTAKSAKERK